MSCARCNGKWVEWVDYYFALGPRGKVRICTRCFKVIQVLIDLFIETPDRDLPENLLLLGAEKKPHEELKPVRGVNASGTDEQRRAAERGRIDDEADAMAWAVNNLPED